MMQYSYLCCLGGNMESIKVTENLEFDAIYADGTRRRVKEGILHEAYGNEIIFHNGTSDPAVIIASAEDILKVLKYMGAGLALLAIKMHQTSESREILRDLVWFADDLLNNSSEEKQGIFRLGQLDMQASVCDMLEATGKQYEDATSYSYAFLKAAGMVRAMEVPNANS